MEDPNQANMPFPQSAFLQEQFLGFTEDFSFDHFCQSLLVSQTTYASGVFGNNLHRAANLHSFQEQAYLSIIASSTLHSVPLADSLHIHLTPIAMALPSLHPP